MNKAIQNPDDLVALTEFVQFINPGDKVEGEYLGNSVLTGASSDGSDMIQYHLLTETAIATFNGTVSMKILKTLPIGTWVQVEYTGQSATDRRVRQFAIRTKRSAVQFMRNAILANARGGQLSLPSPETSDDPFAE